MSMCPTLCTWNGRSTTSFIITNMCVHAYLNKLCCTTVGITHLKVLLPCQSYNNNNLTFLEYYFCRYLSQNPKMIYQMNPWARNTLLKSMFQNQDFFLVQKKMYMKYPRHLRVSFTRLEKSTVQNTTPGWSSEKEKLPHSPSHQRRKRTLPNGIETTPDITTNDQ